MPLNIYYSSLILPSLLLCFPLLACLSILLTVNRGFPGGASGENPAVQCRRLRDKFDPWVRKIPWRREGQPSPVSLPGESHGQRSLAGFKRSIGLQRSQRHDWSELAHMYYKWIFNVKILSVKKYYFNLMEYIYIRLKTIDSRAMKYPQKNLARRPRQWPSLKKSHFISPETISITMGSLNSLLKNFPRRFLPRTLEKGSLQ